MNSAVNQRREDMTQSTDKQIANVLYRLIKMFLCTFRIKNEMLFLKSTKIEADNKCQAKEYQK